MNSNDLLDIIGDARDSHVLDAVKTRNGAVRLWQFLEYFKIAFTV